MIEYVFRREDNQELVRVDFETMMNQKDGYITLADGVMAKRCVHLEEKRDGLPTTERPADAAREIVSDALGVGFSAVEEYRRDAEAGGFSGIEFKSDPLCPTFFRVHCKGPDEWKRYLKHRHFADFNSVNGGRMALSPEDFEKGKELVERQHAHLVLGIK